MATPLSPLQLLRKAYTNKKVVMEHKHQIIFDKKNIISIFLQSGWQSKITNRTYLIGSIWLYLQCERGNLLNYSSQLLEYKLQEIEECDKEDLKSQFLNQNQNIKVQIKQEQNMPQTKSILQYVSSQTNPIKQQHDTYQKSMQQPTSMGLYQSKFQYQENKSQKSSTRAKIQQGQIYYDQLHQKYISSKLAQQKKKGWLQNLKDNSASYVKIQPKRQEFQYIIYQQTKKQANQSQFYGPYYDNDHFNSKIKHDHLIQVIKFVYQIQKPLTNQKKCLQIPKTYFSQHLNFRKINDENLSAKKSRYNMIIQKYKRPVIIVPNQNHFDGTLYLANFQKFAIHGEYVENVIPLATNIIKKHEFSYTLKGQQIIFQMISFKENKQSKEGKDSKGVKDQKDIKQARQAKFYKQMRDTKQHDKNVLDWSLVVGIVIQGRKQEYQFYNNLIRQNNNIKTIKPILINCEKPLQKSLSIQNIKHLFFDKTLRYKDLQVQRQFWKQIQNYLFDHL